MSIRNRTTGAIISISEFRSLHPRTSFPKAINNTILNDFGYDPVFNGPEATVTAPYEISVYDGVEEIDGQWFTKYIAGPVFTDNDEGTAAEHEAAWRAQVDSNAAEQARSVRQEILSSSDWTILPDSPLTTEKKTEWQTYRQALRDISAQEGFPHTITWPTKPS
jgi:hypothetical protein